MGKEKLRYRVHSKEEENCNKGEEILFTCIKLIPSSFKSLYLFKYSLCLKCPFNHSPVGIWPSSNAFALQDEGEGFSPYTLTLTPYTLVQYCEKSCFCITKKYINIYIYIYWTQQQTVCLFDSCLIADFYWIFTVVRKCLKYFQFINSCRSLIAYLGSDSTTNLVKYMDMLFKITCIWLCPGDFTVDFRRL